MSDQHQATGTGVVTRCAACDRLFSVTTREPADIGRVYCSSECFAASLWGERNKTDA